MPQDQPPEARRPLHRNHPAEADANAQHKPEPNHVQPHAERASAVFPQSERVERPPVTQQKDRTRRNARKRDPEMIERTVFQRAEPPGHVPHGGKGMEIGRASCRKRGCTYVEITAIECTLKKNKITATIIIG